MAPAVVNLSSLTSRILSFLKIAKKKKQSYFKWGNVGKSPGLFFIHRSTAKLADKDQKKPTFLQDKGECHSMKKCSGSQD